MAITTDQLTEILKNSRPEDFGIIMDEQKNKMLTEEKPFAAIFRELLKKHNLTQQAVISRAGFSDKYGYRLLAEESHTRQRDYILRLCLGAEFDEEETSRVLRLYGMAPLYAKIPRDALIISYISSEKHDIAELNKLLACNSMTELKGYEEGSVE